ncbi:MAG: TonB-dependent receptor [Pseudomonadota bacterium]
MFQINARRRLGLGLVANLSLALASAAYASDEQRTVELPAQPLREALVALGEVMAITIVAPDELVAQKNSPLLRGTFTPEQALDALLEDTQLEAQRAQSGAWILSARAAEAPQGKSPATPPADDASEPPPLQLEGVVVRGEKVERSLQDTASSVAALSGPVIDESYITDIDQILFRVPNVSGGDGGFSIRGIPERGLGTGTGDTSQTAAIYVDGAVQTQFGASNGLLGTWDVEQVEVYRGAQTTNQGRAALGGAIIVDTVDPSFEWGGRARVALGDFGTRQYALAVGGPLVDDVLAFRLSADVTESDGSITFVGPNAVIDDVGGSERDQYRAKLLFKPSDQLDVTLTYATSDSTTGPSFVNVPPDLSERQLRDTANIVDTQVDSYVLEAGYELSRALTLTSVTAYSDLDNLVAPLAETLEAGGVGITATGQDEQLTQELRLNYDAGGRWRGVAGLYYSDLEEFSARVGSGQVLPGVTLVGSDGYNNSFENYALFMDGEVDLSDEWTMLLGARYDVEDATRNESQRIFTVPPIPAFRPTDIEFTGDSSFSEFLPKLGLRRNFTDDVSLTLTVQRAYRPGGADIRPDTGEAVEFTPEFTTNYDLSLRSLFLDGALTLNANIFYTDYEDMQVRFAPDPAFVLFRFVANAGESKLYGMEVEALWRPTRQLSLYGSLGMLETELGTFLFQGDNLIGNEFPGAQPVSASFGGTWSHPSGFVATLDTIYTGSFFGNLQNIGPKTDDYFISNARVGYKAASYSVFVYGQNLFDEDYGVSIDPTVEGDLAVGVGQPRSFGVILELTF